MRSFKKLNWGLVRPFPFSWPLLNFNLLRTSYAVMVRLNYFFVSFFNRLFFRKFFVFTKRLTFSHILIKHFNSPSYLRRSSARLLRRRIRVRRRKTVQDSRITKKMNRLRKIKVKPTYSVPASLTQKTLILVEIFFHNSRFRVTRDRRRRRRSETYSRINKVMRVFREGKSLKRLPSWNRKSRALLRSHVKNFLTYWRLNFYNSRCLLRGEKLLKYIRSSLFTFAGGLHRLKLDFKSRRPPRQMSYIKRKAIAIFVKPKKKVFVKRRRKKRTIRFRRRFLIFLRKFTRRGLALPLGMPRVITSKRVGRTTGKGYSSSFLTRLAGIPFYRPKNLASKTGLASRLIRSDTSLFRSPRYRRSSVVVAPRGSFFRNKNLVFNVGANFKTLLGGVFFLNHLRRLRWKYFSLKLRRVFSKFGINVLCSFRPINFKGGSAAFFGNYLLKQIKSFRAPQLNRIVKPLIRLIRKSGPRGLDIRAKGRFKKGQRSVRASYSFGVVSLGTITEPTDYKFIHFRTKLGTSSLKVFLQYAS